MAAGFPAINVDPTTWRECCLFEGGVLVGFDVARLGHRPTTAVCRAMFCFAWTAKKLYDLGKSPLVLLPHHFVDPSEAWLQEHNKRHSGSAAKVQDGPAPAMCPTELTTGISSMLYKQDPYTMEEVASALVTLHEPGCEAGAALAAGGGARVDGTAPRDLGQLCAVFTQRLESTLSGLRACGTESCGIYNQ